MKKLLLVLAFCGVFGIVLTNNAIGRVCFFGDKECTTGKIVSHSDIYKAPCKYEDVFACKKANIHSICDEGKDKCYYPMGCDVGYYKTSDKICDIAAYSSLHNKDNNGCSLPITIGGRDCGSIGYGAVYDEFGFSKQTLVFNADSEKIDCYAAISKEDCQKASPHGVCKKDECGNWHVAECAEGYGFYWRNDSGCELGVNFNAEEGDAVCQKCLECDYDTLEKCEEENPRSVCEAAVSDKVENCYNAVKCKEGYFKDEDRNEICEIGTYEKIYYKDKNGCGAPSISTFAPSSHYLWEPIEVSMHSVGIRAFLGKNLADYYDEIDPYDYLAMETEYGAFGSKAKCEEIFKTACVSDMCGFWIRQGEKCEGKYASKEECEEDKGNEHSACEVDETDGCVKPIGCKKGFVSVDDNSEICRIGTYMKLFDIDNNGCGVPGTEGSGGSSPYIECLLGGADGRSGFECLPIARGNYMGDDYSEIDSLDDWFHIMLEYEGSFDTQQNCEITTERGTRKCKADACGRWIWSHAVCNEGYIYGGACPDGLKRADQNYDGTGCWKCECIYKDKTDCETDNSHSVCEMVDGCYKPWGCKPEARRCETEECMSKADPNKCYECSYKSYDECKTKYFHSECIQRGEKCYEPWGCEPGYRRCETEDCMSKTDMDPNKCYECRYKSYDECKTKYFHSKCIQRGERCYEPWGCEPGYKRCETEGCMNKTDMDPNKCYECSIKSIDECNEKYFNSKCIYRGEQCYEVWGCNDNAVKINEAEQYCGKEKVPVFKSEADVRSCVIVECVSKCEYTSKEECEDSEDNFYSVCEKVGEKCYNPIRCKDGYSKECPEGMSFDESVKIDDNGCGKCKKNEPEGCYKNKSECRSENYYSVCENVDGCWRATKCNQWAKTCEEYCKNGKCSLIDADKNGCAEMLYCFGG